MKEFLDTFITYFEQMIPLAGDGAGGLTTAVAEMKKLTAVNDVFPAMLPAIEKWLPVAMNAPVTAAGQPPTALLQQHYRSLSWAVASKEYVGPEYSLNSGYTQIIGRPVRGHEGILFPSQNVAAGFLLIGPHVFYPPHYHAAVEFYSVLTGRAEWQTDDQPPQFQPEGTLIYHPANVPHALKTDTEPLLIMWVWTGEMSRPVSLPHTDWL